MPYCLSESGGRNNKTRGAFQLVLVRRDIGRHATAARVGDLSARLKLLLELALVLLTAAIACAACAQRPSDS